MKFRRIAVGAVTAAVAGGSALLISTASSAAPTPTPTPVLLSLTGMASSSCPAPLNGSLAVSPRTTVQFKPGIVLGGLGPLAVTERLTIKPAPESTDPKSSKVISALTDSNGKIAFTRSATYSLSWQKAVGGGVVGTSTAGKLVVSAQARKCVVQVQVPVASVSAPLVPSAVNSTVNGVLSSAASGVNGALSPVNSAVGPVLGGVEQTVGGITSGLPSVGISAPSGGASGGPTVGTTYKPSGPTVAQRTVPQGYGGGNGAAGTYVGGSSGALDALSPAGAAGKTGTKSPASKTAEKSGGSPKTVELAANKPRSALAGWSTLIVLAAIVALSGASAFYARTYLLHPLPAKVRASAGT